MKRHVSFAQARSLVLTRAGLERERWTDRAIARGVREGTLVRIQRNRYVFAAEWDRLWTESRHRIEVAAVVGEMRGGATVLARESAGVLWGLPLYRHVPTAVHAILPPDTHISGRERLRLHADELSDADVALVDGVVCTSLDRTVFDLVRMLDFDAAVVVADAALRLVASVDGEYDEQVAEEWRERMLARAAAAAGARGVRQAREVLAFADGRAESPVESVARVQLMRLGFRDVRPQVEVGAYRVDLCIEDVGVLLEIDGVVKYEDQGMRAGRSVEEVLLDEKRREDWIRGATQRRVVRLEPRHVATPEALSARLESFGIRVPFA
ncbi:hypothetical protein [Microbacterium sp. SLBN-146]|uniref:hypothetical protein n=1 Tax=Microbacterium sp. SLBN-146 TaxID=2768457 RepID=UPI0011507E62|nr:hypothetical protein [Microbacterium sp. SLBN-146]TQJ31212.1 hypothetical protein FBY39_1675 [Microbacterium sp. SLBN-146]